MQKASRGKWYWDSAENRLVFSKTEIISLETIPALKGKSPLASNVSGVVELEDVKRVAVDLISTELVKSMHKRSVQTFDKCYKTPEMDHFLYEVLKYFHYYLKYQVTSKDEALETQGIVGDMARKELKLTKESFDQSKCNLSAAYIALVAGLNGMRFSHHSLHGELRYSKTQRDKELYEAIYEFTLLVTWITFGYQHWDTIHSIIGSHLRTTSFNKDMTVKSPILNNEDEDDLIDDLGSFVSDDTSIDSSHISWKIQHNRPKPGLLPRTRTPIMEYLYPYYSQTKNKQIPQLAQSSSSCTVGIIGQLKMKFNLKTLKLLQDEEEISTNGESISDNSSTTTDDSDDR